jgi:hypothetical protein
MRTPSVRPRSAPSEPWPPAPPSANGSPPAGAPSSRELPRWDREQGILYWRGQAVLAFVQHAEAQEELLDAFEAHGWVEQIRNPFPHPRTKTARERLHGACKSLTRALKRVGLRFGMRRKGDWVYWEEV